MFPTRQYTANFDLRISKTLQRLAQFAKADVAVLVDSIQVNLQRNEFLGCRYWRSTSPAGPQIMDRPFPPSPAPLMSTMKHWFVAAVAGTIENSTSRSIVVVNVGRKITSAPILVKRAEVWEITYRNRWKYVSFDVSYVKNKNKLLLSIPSVGQEREQLAITAITLPVVLITTASCIFFHQTTR